MQRPALIRHNANLPPNVSKETAFCYQTDSQPYHLNMSMGYQYMHRRREAQRQSSSCGYEDDDDAAFDVTDSEAEGEQEEDDEEDEYETNIHLALDSDNHYSHGFSSNTHSSVDTPQPEDETHDNDNDSDTDNNNVDTDIVNHNDTGNANYQETAMTAEANPIVSVDNSQIDQTSYQNFSGRPFNSNESSETDSKRLTDNLGIHNQSPSRRVPNEETRENGNEDKLDSPNIVNDLDARRRMPSLSYLLPSDDIIISDENENESENSDTENGDNNNTLIICQENDP